MKKKLKVTILCCALIAVIALSPLGPYLLSLGVMHFYSAANEKDSLLTEKGIEIELPAVDGWYPFVMTYSADSGFRQFTGDDDIRLTILYNFPEFDLKRGCSRIYDDSGEYYNSFYGAYAVNARYGFDSDGNFDTETASQVPEYDFTRLVLRDLGMPKNKEVFRWQPTDLKEGVSIAGYDGWTRLDAEMTVNGVLHTPGDYLQNYIQYGKPGYEAADDFAPVEMTGRVYARYFEEWDCSIFLYIMAKDSEVLAECDKELLAGTEIVSFSY